MEQKPRIPETHQLSNGITVRFAVPRLRRKGRTHQKKDHQLQEDKHNFQMSFTEASLHVLF